MTPALRLTAFAAVLAVLVAIGYVIGTAVEVT